MVTLGGAVATVLGGSILHAAPALGLPFMDVPLLLGGVFTADAAGAFWLGWALFFVGGWLVLPLILFLLWTSLPGDPVGFGGAVSRGLLFGAGLALLSGVGVWALSAIARVPGVEGLGFFALGLGAAGLFLLLLLSLGYALALTLVAAMGQGLSPIDALGWVNHGAGSAA